MAASYRVWSGLLVLACLAACGASDDEQRSQPPPVKDTVFGEAVGTMERARSVESTTLQSKQALDSALEQQEGAGEQ